MTLRFEWDVTSAQCNLYKDGALVHSLAQANVTANGICYLRLRGAPVPDDTGYWVDEVTADVSESPGTGQVLWDDASAVDPRTGDPLTTVWLPPPVNAQKVFLRLAVTDG
jgi:hypothetical protein